MVELYILNTNLQLQGVIDTAESVILTKRYNDVDELLITIDANKMGAELLIYGAYIYIGGRNDALLRVYSRNIINSISGTKAQITAYSVEKLLSQRITLPLISEADITVTGTPYTIANKYITQSCINNVDMPYLNYTKLIIVADETALGGSSYTDKTRYKPLHEEIIRLNELEGIGTRSYLNNGKACIEFYRGADRSANNTSGNAPVVFSREYDNLINNNIEQDYTITNNLILVGGQGEGIDRKVYKVSNQIIEEVQAEDIFLAFQDARDLEDEQQLISRAKSELIEPQVNIEAIINPRVQFVYLQDYFIGDIVTLVINGIEFRERITEVVEIYEGNKTEVQITFGQKIYTIADVIKKQNNKISQLETI